MVVSPPQSPARTLGKLSGLKRRTQGPRVVRFIEEFCVHPEGDLVDRPLLLHPFWKQRIYEMFELLPRQCVLCGAFETFAPAGDGFRCTTCEGILESLPPDIRRYSEALIGTPKKNVKSTTLAGIGLYLLVADDDPAALGVCAAASEHQSANLLYGFSRYMCQPSPQPQYPHPLAELVDAFQNELVVKGRPRSRLRNVTSAVGTNDGPVLKFVLADELHEWKAERGRQLYTVLSKGLATRTNSLMAAITTAGFDEDSIEYERYVYGKRVRDGEIDDPRFYFYWLEAPEGCDVRDRKIWAMVNPLLGVTIKENYLEDQVNRNPEFSFRRYNLNQHTHSENVWIPAGAWEACENHTLDLDPERPLYVGIDTAKTIDSSALGLVQLVKVEHDPETGEEIRHYVVRSEGWENPYAVGHPLRAGWVMNNNLIKQRLRELRVQFPKPAALVDNKSMPGPAFLFDPWRFRDEADALAGEGLNMIEVSQTDTNMVPASQALYEAIMFGRIAHDGDPALKRHIYACVAEARDRGFRIERPKGRRIPDDRAVAVAIAILGAQKFPPPEQKKVGVFWA